MLCENIWQAICKRNEFVEKERLHKVRESHTIRWTWCVNRRR